ncbi:unnamed protein product, partial [Ectocarpus sp. 13 AM-2016]
VIEFPRGNNNVEGCNALVEDVPLGARMLAAMANANRLRVWNDPIKRKEKLEVSLSLKQSVWFTKEGIVPSSSSSSSSSASPSATSSSSAETGGSGSRPQTGASSSSSSAAAGPPKKERRRVVYTPANSVSASIVYQGRNRHVYAVASGIIQLPHGNAISEGVTVFPVGHHWVCLALLCAGTPISELPSHMHADLDKEQMDKAIEFANTFWSTSSTQERWGKVETEGLRAMLREIFDDRALAEGGGGDRVSKKDAKDGLTDGKDGVDDDDDDDEDEDEEEHGTGGGNGSDSGSDSGSDRGSSDYGYGAAPGAAATAGMVAEFQGGFDSASDYRGSPLAILREDPGLWKMGGREPARVREAAAGVAAVATAAVEAVEAPLNGAKKKMEMSLGLGRALMEWSESLSEAGRDMAALMGLQAVVMCILGVHRRNVLAGAEETTTAAAAAAIVGEASSSPAGEEVIAAAGDNGGVALSAGQQQTTAGVGEIREDAPTPEGGMAAAAVDGAERGRSDDRFVYGDLARLEAEIFAATGVEDALLHLCPGGHGGGASGAGKGGVGAAAQKSSVLRGVPWLGFLDENGAGRAVGDVEGRLLVWRPPAVVAEALDADLDADPTGWLSDFGVGGIDGGGGDGD